jgi:hypothetical protein
VDVGAATVSVGITVAVGGSTFAVEHAAMRNMPASTKKMGFVCTLPHKLCIFSQLLSGLLMQTSDGYNVCLLDLLMIYDNFC